MEEISKRVGQIWLERCPTNEKLNLVTKTDDTGNVPVMRSGNCVHYDNVILLLDFLRSSWDKTLANLVYVSYQCTSVIYLWNQPDANLVYISYKSTWESLPVGLNSFHVGLQFESVLKCEFTVSLLHLSLCKWEFTLQTEPFL